MLSSLLASVYQVCFTTEFAAGMQIVQVHQQVAPLDRSCTCEPIVQQLVGVPTSLLLHFLSDIHVAYSNPTVTCLLSYLSNNKIILLK